MRIPVSHGFLEANFREAETPVRGGAVICHPHPLHGGTMHTKAVFRAAQALTEVGFHVLRFNFRGVGTSTGSYGEGIEEKEDAEAALDWLRGEYPSLPLLLGGFSFGSMVALSVGLEDEGVHALLGMGLPIRLYDFSFLDGMEKPLLVVQGEEDEFGAGTEVREVLDRLDGPITVVTVPGAGHFFDDHFDELKASIRGYFKSGPGASAFPSLGNPGVGTAAADGSGERNRP